MNLNEMNRGIRAKKKRKRVGRGAGSGHGKTSGRGGKGYTARSGSSVPSTYAGGQMPYFRRIPKRGFTNAPFRVERAIVPVGSLARFEAGSVVGPGEMLSARIVRSIPPEGIKVLADGELDRPLTVRAQAFSKRAAEKIAAAGGKAEVVKA